MAHLDVAHMTCMDSHVTCSTDMDSHVTCSTDMSFHVTRLLPLGLLLVLCTRNNTNGNKLVIFSGIALYYGDTYITSLCLKCCTSTKGGAHVLRRCMNS